MSLVIEKWFDVEWEASASGIAFDAAGNSGDQSATNTYSGSASWAGSSRMLAVDVSMLGPGVTVTSMTYGGAACTFVGAISTVTSFGRVEQWRICSSDAGAPAAGANTLVVNLSGSIEFAVEWASYINVHQTAPTEAFNSAQATNAGSATDASVAVTSIADKCWIHAAVTANDTSITAGNTSRNNVSGTLGSGANEDNGADKTPAGAVTMSYSGMGVTTTWAISGYAIRPLSATNNNPTITPSAGTLSLSGTTVAVLTAMSLNPTVGSIALTGIAPTLVQGAVRSPSVAALSLTGQTSVVIQGAMRSPNVGAVTLTGIAPVLSQGLIIPGNAVPPQLSLSGVAPLVTRQDTITPSAGSLTLTGSQAAVSTSAGQVIVPNVGSLTLVGQLPIQDLDVDTASTGVITLSGIAPVVLQGTVRVPNAAALTITGQTVSVTQQNFINPSAGSLTLSGQLVTILGNVSIAPTAGALSLTGQPVGITQQAVRAPTVASVVLTGAAPIVSQGAVLAPTAGQLALSGTQAQVGMTITTAPAAGSIALTGQFPQITIGASSAGTGALTLSGNAPVLIQGTVVIPTAGTLTINGLTSVLGYSYTVTASSSTVALQGASPVVTQGTIIVPSAGSLSLSPQTSVASRGTLITGATGALTVTGQTAQALASQVITPIAGALFISGYLPSLIFGVINPPSGVISLTGAPPLVNVYDPSAPGNLVGPGARLKLKLNL